MQFRCSGAILLYLRRVDAVEWLLHRAKHNNAPMVLLQMLEGTSSRTFFISSLGYSGGFYHGGGFSKFWDKQRCHGRDFVSAGWRPGMCTL